MPLIKGFEQGIGGAMSGLPMENPLGAMWLAPLVRAVDPTFDSRVRLWWDAQDTNTLKDTFGWYEKKTGLYAATVNSMAISQINGRRWATSSGGTRVAYDNAWPVEYLPVAAEECTIFYVVYVPSTYNNSSGRFGIGGYGNSSWNHYVSLINEQQMLAQWVGGDAGGTTAITPLPRLMIVASTWNRDGSPGKHDLRVNGALVSTQDRFGQPSYYGPAISGAHSARLFDFSGSEYSLVSIGEKLVCSAMSTDDKLRYEAYLSKRWGIALDPNHPYRV